MHTFEDETNIQEIQVDPQYTLDVLFNEIKVTEDYPYMYYKGMYKIDMGCKIDLKNIDPPNPGAALNTQSSMSPIDMYMPTRKVTYLHDGVYVDKKNNFAFDNVSPDDLGISITILDIDTQTQETIPTTKPFSASVSTLFEKLLKKHNLSFDDVMTSKRMAAAFVWKGIYTTDHDKNKIISVTIRSDSTILVEYQLQTTYNDRCICIKSKDETTSAIYDKNYYTSLIDPAFVYTGPRLVFYGEMASPAPASSTPSSNKTSLYNYLRGANILKDINSEIKIVRVQYNDPGLDIDPHTWLDACLNNQIFNKYIYIDDFTKINENANLIKMKLLGDNNESISLDTTLSLVFKLNIKRVYKQTCSGEEPYKCEDGSCAKTKDDCITSVKRLLGFLEDMVNAYKKSQEDGTFRLYKMIGEEKDEQDDTDWRWWAVADKGRTGKIKKGKHELWSGKGKDPNWYDQVYVKDNSYTRKCQKKFQPVAIPPSQFKEDDERYKKITKDDIKGDHPHFRDIYISCNECESKTEDECKADDICVLEDGKCKNKRNVVSISPKKSPDGVFCCLEGSRGSRDVEPDDVLKNDATIDTKKFAAPQSIATFVGGPVYRKQSVSMDDIIKSSMGIRANLLYNLWGDQKDMYEYLFTKLSQKSTYVQYIMGQKISTIEKDYLIVQFIYDLCQQENYDLTLRQFTYVLKNKYINPRRFIRLIEYLEDANIIIFTKRGDKKINIALPNYTNRYLYVPSPGKKTIVIYEHYGNNDNSKVLKRNGNYPMCQIIYADGSDQYKLDNVSLDILHKQYTPVESIVQLTGLSQCFNSTGKTQILQYKDRMGMFNMFLKDPIAPLPIPSVTFEECLKNTMPDPQLSNIPKRLYKTVCEDGDDCVDIPTQSKDYFYKTQKVAKLLVDIVKYKFSSFMGDKRDVSPTDITTFVRTIVPKPVDKYNKYTITYIYDRIFPNIQMTTGGLKYNNRIKLSPNLYNDITTVSDDAYQDVIKKLTFILQREMLENYTSLQNYKNNIFFPNFFETAHDWVEKLHSHENLLTNAVMFTYWVEIQNSL
jgi:hypothetical protein